MHKGSFDVLILGAGFAGSLTAIIARRLGLSVALIERSRHPRFAIGESSTPLANLMLESLATTYDLPWLATFSKYGPWKRHHPEVACGLKRGFTFFRHTPGVHFRPTADNANALFVEASPDDERGDTHWYRADFDAHLVERAVEAGVTYFDRTVIETIAHANRWHLSATCPAGALSLDADFVVDATGACGALASAIGLETVDSGFRTSSYGLYGHFRHVLPWEQILDELGGASVRPPFSADASALHHIIDGGWMWVLRFDNGITSAGFSLDPQRHPASGAISPDAQWQALVTAYPSIGRQFRGAQATMPIVRTGRLQRRLSAAAGEDWAALPYTACFLDPWLSPGIAHTLFGVRRLARILGGADDSAPRREQLRTYSETVLREVELMDRITATCFARFDCFEILASVTMPYFAAVTYMEERIRAGKGDEHDAFLLADNERFRAIVDGVCSAAMATDAKGAAGLARETAAAIEPYNTVGLCDPAKYNVYPFAP
ncbi:MAG: tryptophan 7-halogenase [Planctomycetes bacterium]|nr:tryptophan 7-halogenase [Planctomycetota bacterium]